MQTILARRLQPREDGPSSAYSAPDGGARNPEQYGVTFSLSRFFRHQLFSNEDDNNEASVLVSVVEFDDCIGDRGVAASERDDGEGQLAWGGHARNQQWAASGCFYFANADCGFEQRAEFMVVGSCQQGLSGIDFAVDPEEVARGWVEPEVFLLDICGYKGFG